MTYTDTAEQYGRILSQHRGGVSTLLHGDALGSTRTVTDAGEQVVATAIYSAFGEEVASSGTVVNPFGFVGALGRSGDRLY